jgi:hypothetical protein
MQSLMLITQALTAFTHVALSKQPWRKESKKAMKSRDRRWEERKWNIMLEAEMEKTGAFQSCHNVRMYVNIAELV